MIFFLSNSLDMVVVGGATDDSQSRVTSKSAFLLTSSLTKASTSVHPIPQPHLPTLLKYWYAKEGAEL